MLNKSQELSKSWSDLLERSRHPSGALSLRAPLCRERILAAEADIRHLIDALDEAPPESSRGVASAWQLLSDGTGPLYNSRSRQDLGALVRQATATLN